MDAPDPFDASQDREIPVGPQSIVRRLAGHWRRILLLWLVLATPAAYLIYTLLPPTYEAFSLLQVQPRRPDLFGPGLPDNADRVIAQPYLETQVQLLTSDMILDSALARPATTAAPLIAGLPMIATSKDPKAVLRKEMVVEIVKNTFLIRVALTSREPLEAAAIVNAVVDSYLEQHGDYHRSANKVLKKSLDEELQTLDVKIAEKKKELRELLERGHIIRLNRPLVKSNTVKEDNEGIQPSLATVTEEQFTKATDRLLQADFDLIDARVRLETARILELKTSAETLREREGAVEEAKRKRAGYAHYLARLEVQSKPQNRDTFEVTMATQELEGLLKMQEIIQQKLEELRFSSKQDVYRVTRHDQAQVPKVPATNPRVISMPAASVGILFLVLGLFLTREIRATRAGDTETSTGPSA